MELLQILKNSIVVVISVLVFIADFAYIFYLNRDRNRWKHTANCYQILSEKYKHRYQVNLVEEESSERYKVINSYNEQSAI